MAAGISRSAAASARTARPRRRATVVMSYSFHKLPEVAMKPRLCDNRVGYFSMSVTDYSRPEQKATERCYITRYRLEKKDPEAPISEPVKQIVYYIDPDDAEGSGVPWLIKGVRGLAARIRGRRLQERDRGEGSAEAIRTGRRRMRATPSSVGCRRRRRTHRAERARSAARRDPERAHPVLSQRADAGADVVLHAGRGARSARAHVPAARFADGASARVRRGARGRSHARLPAQHEGELDVPDRQHPERGLRPKRWATRRR